MTAIVAENENILVSDILVKVNNGNGYRFGIPSESYVSTRTALTCRRWQATSMNAITASHLRQAPEIAEVEFAHSERVITLANLRDDAD